MSVTSSRWSPVSAWKNSLVPDLAIVPMWSITSCRLIPMPLSPTVMVRASLSYATRMRSLVSSSWRSGADSASKRSLSAASDALEISSRRKISFWLYREWTMRSRTCTTSAWKPNRSVFPATSMVSLNSSGRSVARPAPGWGRGLSLYRRPSTAGRLVTGEGAMREVWVRGAAMTPFGKHNDRSARDLVEDAVAGALSDAAVAAGDVQFVYVANALAGAIGGQECLRAQTVLRRTGLMGVPMVTVENADCSGSTALHLAWQAVANEAYDCVLVVGYEKFDHADRAKSYRAFSSAVDLSELAD